MNKSEILMTLSLSVFSALLIDCVSKESLPTFSEAEQSDTSYIQITPNWTAAEYGFSSPKDIILGEDSYLFIADSGNGRVLVLDRAGNQIQTDEYGNDFAGLANLEISNIGLIEPLRLAQDSKMNLFIANGSNKVFAWNQYFNNVGVDSIATSLILYNGDTSDQFALSNIDSLIVYAKEGYGILHIKFEKKEERINEILSPHIFYDGEEIKNILNDEYADPRNSKIIDIATFGQDYSAGLYLLDYRYNRIIKTYYYIKDVLLLSNGSIVFNYGCWFNNVVTGQGNGAGYIMKPNSMSVDESGNIYYTQTGGNFYCHGLAGGSYRTLFDPDIDDITDSKQYGIASDICVDLRGVIYVADAGFSYIHSFNSVGAFIRNIGTEVVDSTEVGYIFNHPESIIVNEDILYVADTGNSQIVRFQYIILSQQSASGNND